MIFHYILTIAFVTWANLILESLDAIITEEEEI